MSVPWRINVFGVRHLSPAGAWHLRRYLDQIKPDLVLIEGLADATELISQVTRKGTKPPIAMLAYTDSLPVRTLIYPFAKYSPEFRRCAGRTRTTPPSSSSICRPTIFLALQDIEAELREKMRRRLPGGAGADADTPPAADGSTPTDETPPDEVPTPPPEVPVSLYEQYARPRRRTGLRDLLGAQLRAQRRRRFLPPGRVRIRPVAARARPGRPALARLKTSCAKRSCAARSPPPSPAGHKPEKIVAVVGAFHAPVLTGDFPAMTDDELASLRRRSSKFTLMPYSYFKLSSQSGYGAGNQAPAYYELLWEALERDDLAGLPSQYLSLVARHMRDSGTHRSTAEVIEGVRLANTLSALKDGLAPTLIDLRDAAVTLVGHGELSAVKDAIARVEVGTAIGELPKGVSRTSIQADFEREMTRLKLEKYKTTVKQELSLDLRENRQAKSAESAFLDLNRSSFFHRLPHPRRQLRRAAANVAAILHLG
jgi:hypothetical protein